MRTQMSAKDWAALGFLSLLWGGSFFFYKVLAGHVPPLIIAAVRVAFAGTILAALVGAGRIAMFRSGAACTAFIIMGLLNNVLPFTLIAWSETQISSGLAAIFNATTPIFSVLLGGIAGLERLTPARAVGVAIGFVGVVVLAGADAIRAINPASIAQLCVLASSISYACAAIYWRRSAPALDSATASAAGQLLGAALISVPLAAAAYLPLSGSALHFSTALRLSPALWLALAGLTLLCTALPYPIYFRLLAKAGATNALLVTLLVPISALALGGLFLGERLPLTAYIGMGIIFASLAIIDGRALAWARRRRSPSEPSEAGSRSEPLEFL